MRLISFMLTKGQILAQTKTQTRRVGSERLKPGDRLRGVLKCQARRRRSRMSSPSSMAGRRAGLDALVDRIGSAIGKARADDLAGCVSRARVAARAAK